MKGMRTSRGNKRQFAIGDRVRVTGGSQWHAGDVGRVVDCEEGRALINLPGTLPRTRDQEWISIDNLISV